MKLRDLIDQVGDDDDVTFEIVQSDWNWDHFDTVCALSRLLEPFYDWKIISLTATKENVFRFELMEQPEVPRNG